MNRVLLTLDQHITIGRDMRVVATDIDAKGVRLVAEGRVLGGAADGEAFEKVYEMTVGSSINLSPHVAVTLVKIRDGKARLDVFAPANVPVQSK